MTGNGAAEPGWMRALRWFWQSIQPRPLTPEERNRRYQDEMLHHAREQTRIAQWESEQAQRERDRQRDERNARGGPRNPLEYGDRRY